MRTKLPLLALILALSFSSSTFAFGDIKVDFSTIDKAIGEAAAPVLKSTGNAAAELVDGAHALGKNGIKPIGKKMDTNELKNSVSTAQREWNSKDDELMNTSNAAQERVFKALKYVTTSTFKSEQERTKARIAFILHNKDFKEMQTADRGRCDNKVEKAGEIIAAEAKIFKATNEYFSPDQSMTGDAYYKSVSASKNDKACFAVINKNSTQIVQDAYAKAKIQAPAKKAVTKAKVQSATKGK